MEQEEMTANRDHHSSMFQIQDEVKDPTETQYHEHEELEDLVLNESLTRVWMFVQVSAGSEISFHRDINDTKYFALSGDYSRSASQDAQRDAVRNVSFQVGETRLWCCLPLIGHINTTARPSHWPLIIFSDLLTGVRLALCGSWGHWAHWECIKTFQHKINFTINKSSLDTLNWFCKQNKIGQLLFGPVSSMDPCQ